MNTSQGPYFIIKEMLETSNVVGSFDLNSARQIFQQVANTKKILFTGEGSSRKFPAHHAIAKAMSYGLPQQLQTESCHHAREWQLHDWIVLGASNSGRTKETILLFEKLKEDGVTSVGITAHKDTPLEKLSMHTFLLSCGQEKATAATKSTVEQALFYDALVCQLTGIPFEPKLKRLKDNSAIVLSSDIPTDIIELCATAPQIYFTGRNNGVAEELALKAVEIIRKPTNFLEGTSALHGYEETMSQGELIVVVDPFEKEELAFEKVLKKGVGVNIIAISSRETRFPTILVPDEYDISPYLQLMAGWNMLVNTGIKLAIDIDRPARARKIGNEI